MALDPSTEFRRTRVEDIDGRLIVVGPGGVPIGGGGGGGVASDVSVNNFPADQLVHGPLTDSQLRASPVPTSVINFPASQVVTGPLTDAQLRASSVPVSGNFFPGTQPVSGPLTDTQLRASAVPVSGPITDAQLRASSVPVDVSDRAARENGRVRLWDGADEATVIQRGTIPSATDKGLAVVPLNQPRPSYQVVTPEITSGTAVAIARPLQLWHPATLLKDVFIIEIGANVGVQHTAGRFAFEIEFITAESATGTLITANVQQMNRGDSVTGLTARHSVTAETPVAAGVFQRAVQGPSAATTPQGTNYDGVVIYRAKDLDDYSDAILLRNGVAEGLLVRQNIIAILTGAPIYSIYARWIERA